MIFSHLNVHLYWHLYLSLLENVTSYGIDGHTFNAAEAIGVLTNVSPVTHMEVFGWDANNCFSPHVDRKELDRGEVSGMVLSFVHLPFSLLEIVNSICY